MSDKMTCPGCDSHLSSIQRAFDDGEAMPCCGLSYRAVAEIRAIRQHRADTEIEERATAAVARADKAERELAMLKTRYRLLERLIGKSGEVLKGELDDSYTEDDLYV